MVLGDWSMKFTAKSSMSYLPSTDLADVMSEEAKQHLNRAWHRLDGWPDSPSGLRRLKSKFIIATASNGNLALLVNMAKHADLPWDAVMSPDVYGAYKPSPKVYNNASKLLGVQHRSGDDGSGTHQRLGSIGSSRDLATAFIYRPLERGADNPVEMPDTSLRSTSRRPISTIWQTSWVAPDLRETFTFNHKNSHQRILGHALDIRRRRANDRYHHRG